MYQPGKGCGQGKYENKETKNPRKPEFLLNPYGALSGKETATFKAFKEHIMQYIQRTYSQGQDVAICLHEMRRIDLRGLRPTLGRAESEDPEAKQIKQKGVVIRYQAKLTRYMDMLDTLDQNPVNAYLLIFTLYCSKLMRNRVEAYEEFESEIRDKPI